LELIMRGRALLKRFNCVHLCMINSTVHDHDEGRT